MEIMTINHNIDDSSKEIVICKDEDKDSIVVEIITEKEGDIIEEVDTEEEEDEETEVNHTIHIMTSIRLTTYT